jgi:hypothetical protein
LSPARRPKSQNISASIADLLPAPACPCPGACAGSFRGGGPRASFGRELSFRPPTSLVLSDRWLGFGCRAVAATPSPFRSGVDGYSGHRLLVLRRVLRIDETSTPANPPGYLFFRGIGAIPDSPLGPGLRGLRRRLRPRDGRSSALPRPS